MIGSLLLTLLALLVVAAAIHIARFLWLYHLACRRRPEITVVPSFLGIGMMAMLGDVLLPEKLGDWFPFFRASDFASFSHAAWVQGGRKDVLCIVSMVPLAASYTIANADLGHELVEGDTVEKQTEAYVVLEFFGRNIVTTQGDEWRKHRKICTGAFTKSNLRLVRAATTRQLSEMTKSWDASADDKGEVVVKLGGNDDYTRMTLGVFGEAIFGAEMDVFSERARDVASLDSFCTRLMFSTSNLHVAMLVPKWLKRWPFTFFQKVDRTLQRMDNDMLDMLLSARRDEGEACKDLLSLLSRSNQRSDPLTEREAIADVWMFCVAGMETSAHTLGWLTMRIAFHTDVQQKVRRTALLLRIQTHRLSLSLLRSCLKSAARLTIQRKSLSKLLPMYLPSCTKCCGCIRPSTTCRFSPSRRSRREVWRDSTLARSCTFRWRRFTYAACSVVLSFSPFVCFVVESKAFQGSGAL